MASKDVVVLHSGGQDSTTALAWAIAQWGRRHIYPVTFDYGQRHAVEMEQADKITSALDVPEAHVIDAGALRDLGAAALTNTNIDVELKASPDRGGAPMTEYNTYAAEHNLPSTFVPGRNMLFFTLAAAYGAGFGSSTLVTGVCATDRAGYPDCRVEFVSAAERALTLALDEDVHILAPLLRRSKSDTFALAEELGVLELVLEQTHTCYHGDRSQRHDWGYGCGECPACDERRRGWEEFRHSKFVNKLP